MMNHRCPFQVLRRSVARMSTWPKKPPTHYQTLEIKPGATQEDIKSAYYRLTKMYHPDKNQSKDAEEKFRSISEAYEVLGSYESRKTYDRGMFIKRSNPTMTRTQGKKEDPRMKWYKTEGIYPENFFDIDAWNRAHYGENFERMEKIKKDIENYRKRHQRPVNDEMTWELNKSLGIILFSAATVVLVLIIIEIQDFDRVMEQSLLEEVLKRPTTFEEFDLGNEKDTEDR